MTLMALMGSPATFVQVVCPGDVHGPLLIPTGVAPTQESFPQIALRAAASFAGVGIGGAPGGGSG